MAGHDDAQTPFERGQRQEHAQHLARNGAHHHGKQHRGGAAQRTQRERQHRCRPRRAEVQKQKTRHRGEAVVQFEGELQHEQTGDQASQRDDGDGASVEQRRFARGHHEQHEEEHRGSQGGELARDAVIRGHVCIDAAVEYPTCARSEHERDNAEHRIRRRGLLQCSQALRDSLHDPSSPRYCLSLYGIGRVEASASRRFRSLNWENAGKSPPRGERAALRPIAQNAPGGVVSSRQLRPRMQGEGSGSSRQVRTSGFRPAAARHVPAPHEEDHHGNERNHAGARQRHLAP